MKSSSPTKVFYLLIVSQYGGTSLWFATNAILSQLQAEHLWLADALGWLVSAVQLGFIIGTLCISITGLTDKFSPSKIFFIGSLLGSIGNVLCLLNQSSFSLMISSRFLTGVCLAAIYPVGMKIASDWREQGLGHWLGALVGALVLGTAFPQALKLFPQFVDAQIMTVLVSVLALVSGVLVLFFIPDGPYRKAASKFSFHDVRLVFGKPNFRSAAFGYFGHMWEVYAFWAFVPWMISSFNSIAGNNLSVPWWSFSAIGAGAIGCWVGGLLSQKFGSKSIATVALISSGICCLCSPFIFQLPSALFLIIIIFWGFMAASDSPQFSALVAQNAPQQVRGSAITITTCIGFTITIFSIQLLNQLMGSVPTIWMMIMLLPGPVFGVVSLLNKGELSQPT